MKKATDIIMDVEKNGNLADYNMTLAEFNEFRLCVCELHNNRKVSTLVTKVKDMLVECGFTANPTTIGWNIV